MGPSGFDKFLDGAYNHTGGEGRHYDREEELYSPSPRAFKEVAFAMEEVITPLIAIDSIKNASNHKTTYLIGIIS